MRAPRPIRTGVANRFDRAAAGAFVAAAVTLAASGIGFRAAVGHLNVYLDKQPVSLRRHLSGVPRTLGRWEAWGEDHLLDEASVEALGTDKYLNRIYALKGSPGEGSLWLHVAYYTGMIDAVPHIPDRCIPAAGGELVALPTNYELAVAFPDASPDPEHSGGSGEPYRLVTVPHPVTGRREQVRLPFGEYRLRTYTFSREDRDDIRHYGGIFFIANHQLTASPAYIRTLAFKPSERFAYYVKVQLEMTVSDREGPERYLELSSDFVQELVPHLMRCLPDWAEIESRSETAPPPRTQEVRGPSWQPGSTRSSS